MLYYELLERSHKGMSGIIVGKGIYARDEHLECGDMPPGLLSYAANRIWREQDGKVDYVKHKGGNPEGQVVDMKEFTFIKLVAELV